MDRDRSLDEFLSPSQSDTTPDSSSEGATTDQETDVSLETESDVATLTVHPARSTMVWTAEGAVCDACDSDVQRRWRDDERLVCSACKEW